MDSLAWTLYSLFYFIPFWGDTSIFDRDKFDIFMSIFASFVSSCLFSSCIIPDGYHYPVIVVAMVERIHYNREESIQHSINLVLLLSSISNSGMCKASFAGPLTENPRLNLLQKIVIMKGEIILL